MMVTRVSLLLLVTGLFAGMWSTDSPDERTAAQKQLTRLASTPCSVAPTPLESAYARNVSFSGRLETRAVPLPKGIAPGNYLVVNQAGMTQRLTITAHHGVSEDNHTPVDQYSVRSGNCRWHFIRLDQPQEQGPGRKITQSPAAAPR